MRQTYIAVLAVLIVVSALILANFRTDAANSVSPASNGIVLTGLPTDYCPTQAEVYREDRIGRASIVTVASCNNIPFDELSLSGEERLAIKLPNALAFPIFYKDGVDRYSIGLRVGDVNSDDSIDEQDTEIVTANLFSTSSEADVDMDGEVTVLDLSLTKINRAVGEVRSDGKEWKL